MSLIADALRAAQQERELNSERRTEGARRFLSGSGDRRSAAHVAAEWLHTPIHIPPRVAWSGAVFFLALSASVALVAFAPRAPLTGGPLLATGLIDAPLAAADPSTTAGATSGQAVAVAEGTPGDQLPSPSGEADDEDLNSVPEATTPAIQPELNQTESPAASPAPPPDDLNGPEIAAPITSPVQPQASSFELAVDRAHRPNAVFFVEAVEAQNRRDFASAVDLYKRALEVNPGDAEVLNNLGLSYQEMGRLVEARDAFQEAVTVEPQYSAAWSNLSVALGALGDDRESRAALAEAIRLDSSDPGLKVNLAIQYRKQGLTKDAKRLLLEVLESDPKMAEAHFALAGILEEEKNLNSAIRHYQLFLVTGAGRFPAYEAEVAARIERLQNR